MAVTRKSQGSAVFAPFFVFCAGMSGKNCAHAAAWAFFDMQLWIPAMISYLLIGILVWILTEEKRAAEGRSLEGN